MDKTVKPKKQNMYEDSVKQWNPFKGCKFDCIYCLASFQRQAKRQKSRCMDCYNYAPHTHEDRLNDSLPKTGKNGFIFSCSSGDVSYCPTSFLKKIVQRIESEPDKTFLIQTKNPKTLNRVKFPENVILGITLETNRDDFYHKVSKAPKPSERFKDFLNVDHPTKMVTIEPVMEFDLDILVDWIKQINPKLVWLGYDSKKEGLFPEPSIEKFNNLHQELVNAGFKVKLKTVRQ